MTEWVICRPFTAKERFIKNKYMRVFKLYKTLVHFELGLYMSYYNIRLITYFLVWLP